ncbi:very short patch repair endonuclease [uncultured Clostridium sp.]|uniref:very short patch repair endonuclease n=1 Tax=uncultured Clostridium sp. TaxID=59620 RepID=UPI0025FA4CBC|nr:very short patch repair endonuclease [uncultured Clostridium sp.]
MDRISKEKRRKIMKHIRGKNTKIEIILRKALWHKGIRYRKNYKKLPGSPDIVLTKYKIAIFCDGEFFHGYDWINQKKRLENSNNSEYWIKKISRNISRDIEIDKQLFASDWTVVHFWGKYILKHTDECVRYIKELIYEKELDKNYIDDSDSYFND